MEFVRGCAKRKDVKSSASVHSRIPQHINRPNERPRISSGDQAVRSIADDQRASSNESNAKNPCKTTPTPRHTLSDAEAGAAGTRRSRLMDVAASLVKELPWRRVVCQPQTSA